VKKYLLLSFLIFFLLFCTYSAKSMVEMRPKAPNTEGVSTYHKPSFIERFLLKRLQKQWVKKQKRVMPLGANFEPNCDTIFTTNNQIIVAQILDVSEKEIIYKPCAGKGAKKWLSTLEVRDLKSAKFKYNPTIYEDANETIPAKLESSCDTFFTTDNQIIAAQIVSVTKNEVGYLPCNGKGAKKWLFRLDIRTFVSTKFKNLDDMKKPVNKIEAMGTRALIFGILSILLPVLLYLGVGLLGFIIRILSFIFSIKAIKQGSKVAKHSKRAKIAIFLGALGFILSLFYLIILLLAIFLPH
jgi:hypothetical protein